jgi:hypothetical protein
MAKKYINISATADIGLCNQYIGVLQGSPLQITTTSYYIAATRVVIIRVAIATTTNLILQTAAIEGINNLLIN